MQLPKLSLEQHSDLAKERFALPARAYQTQGEKIQVKATIAESFLFLTVSTEFTCTIEALMELAKATKLTLPCASHSGPVSSINISQIFLSVKRIPCFQVCPWKQVGGEVDAVHLTLLLSASWAMAQSLGAVWRCHSIKNVTWCCYSGWVLASCSQQCSSVMHSEHQCAMWVQHGTCGGCSECSFHIYWEKSESLKMKSFSWEQDVVFCVQTSLYSHTIQSPQISIKNKVFSGPIFHLTHQPWTSTPAERLCFGPSPWQAPSKAGGTAGESSQTSAHPRSAAPGPGQAPAVCTSTVHRMSLLLQTHLLPLPSHGKGVSSQMRSLLSKERPAGNVFQGSRSSYSAPKQQRTSPSSFQWNSLSKNKAQAWTVSQRQNGLKKLLQQEEFSLCMTAWLILAGAAISF